MQHFKFESGPATRDAGPKSCAPRTIISGGDTSGHALQQLGIHALTLRYPLKSTPGSPVCLAHSGDKNFNGMEIAMKGGQIGADDYFVCLREGMSPVRNPPGLRP